MYNIRPARWQRWLQGAAPTLLAKLGLALLASRHHHVADSRARHLIQATLDALHGDNVQVLCARIVSAVHDRANAQTEGRAELVTHGTTAACENGDRQEGRA